MYRQKSNNGGRNPAKNANRLLPEGLGSLLMEEIRLLPDCPKAIHLKNEYLKKFVSDDTAPASTRRARAIAKWLATERENEATNDRLINTHEDFQILPRVKMVDFLEFLRNTVADIIGDTVPDDALIGSFSGGASTSRKRTESLPAQKYLGKAHVTKEASHWVEELRSSIPGWSSFWDDLTIETVPGNVLFTVPKTTDIDRCACKEPDINMFLQKGAGDVIRASLREVGINLNDQSRNQRLARKGSIDGSLATLDLASASDSVSYELVMMVLPPLWASHLNSLRSRVTLIDGEEHVNQMFSSMGNGFTFELESLLFYALARATAYFTGTRGVISVYGDDLIVPSPMYHDLVWVLLWFGFSVNSDKSFHEGPFRESCGGHFINGRDITPFYVKEPILTLSDLIKFCNGLRRWSEYDSEQDKRELSVWRLSCDPDVFPLWEFASSFVPKRFWGSKDFATRYQLYSPGSPKDRLVPITSVKSMNTGGYIHWLNSTTWRTESSDGVVTSEATVEASHSRMQIRRALRTVNLDVPHFYQEV